MKFKSIMIYTIKRKSKLGTLKRFEIPIKLIQFEVINCNDFYNKLD